MQLLVLLNVMEQEEHYLLRYILHQKVLFKGHNTQEISDLSRQVRTELVTATMHLYKALPEIPKDKAQILPEPSLHLPKAHSKILCIHEVSNMYKVL